MNTEERKPIRGLIVWLVAFTIEGLITAAGIIYLTDQVGHIKQLAYFEVPVLLFMMCVIAWQNISEHYHPELEEE